MATLPEVVRFHYEQSERLARRIADSLAALWDATVIGSGDWESFVAPAVQLIAAGQLTSAAQADAYVAAVLALQGAPEPPLATIPPARLAGSGADGGSLATLVGLSVLRARALILAGMPPAEAVIAGKARAVLTGANEVTQAGITSATAATALRPQADGYIRHLVTPSCSRCILLAGKWFRWNEGFLRHPRCDCKHVPATKQARVDSLLASPGATFDSMTTAQQDATFTRAGAQAIRDGANMGRVVNARQSMSVPKGRKSERGTPTVASVEDCLTRSGGNREKFVALLDAAGYFV